MLTLQSVICKGYTTKRKDIATHSYMRNRSSQGAIGSIWFFCKKIAKFMVGVHKNMPTFVAK